MVVAAALAPMLLLAGACGGTSPKAVTTTTAQVTTSTPTSGTSTSTSTSTPTTSTTQPVATVTGPVTVLSPIGLNVRAKPSHSAAIIGSAAEGTVLQLLAHTGQSGGWYEVEGATVTGWISANPAYSARGRFGDYQSGPFSVLYPAGWMAAGSPPTGVTFRPVAGVEKVVIAAAAKVADLPTVKQGGGVSETSSKPVVACGVTSYLDSYTTAVPHQYLVDLLLPVAAHHYIGLDARLTSVSQLSTVLVFVNSLSFPFPECVGPSPTATTRPKPSHHKTPATA